MIKAKMEAKAVVAEDFPHFGKCKCCLRETYLRNMWYTEKGQTEVYGQMLVDCFAIDWMIQGNVQDDKICEACISKLKVAVNFKTLVQQSQSEILSGKEVNAVEENVKESEEKLVEEEEEESSNLNGAQKTYEDVEFLEEEVVDGETDDYDSQGSEPAEKKPRRKQYTNEDLKNALDAVKAKKISKLQAEEIFKVPRITISKRLTEDTDGDGIDQQTPEDDLDTILQKHRENIRSILMASNATPIKGHWGIGYACCFCPQQFAESFELKQHTFTHGTLVRNIKIKSLPEHIVKLDVTDLKCNICNVKIGAFDNLMVHLKERHKMSIHLDIPNHIVPFCFANSVFKCVKCPKKFESFKTISDHMNDAHYRNYECGVCCRGFVNVRSLKTHSIAHGINIFGCIYCAKVFDTKTEMADHEKTHLTKTTSSIISRKVAISDDKLTETPRKTNEELVIKRKTTVSDEKITNTADKACDIAQSSDTTKAEHKCKICPKSFESRSDLLYHINSVHKRYKCPVCECTFDFQFKLKKHVIKKHAAHSFGCTMCPKIYINEDHLKDHMLEHNEKEFCCEVCGCGFNKECNYMAHMKNNHGLE